MVETKSMQLVIQICCCAGRCPDLCGHVKGINVEFSV